MASFQGPSTTPEIWMVGSPTESAADARKRVAKGLLFLIKDREYDSQTLEEILLVIDHECLCREVGPRGVQGASDIFQSTIGIVVVGDFADQLSSCLVPFNHVSSHFERALQCRALLSVLTLLHIHGVRGQQVESHTKWQKQIKQRFRDRVWQPGESTDFSPEVFHTIQCSHLLSLVAAYYSQHFIRAEPIASVLLDLANNLMRIGVAALNVAFGLGVHHMGSILTDLDENLSRLLETPNNRFLDLFELQGLTRIALALHNFLRVNVQFISSHQNGVEAHRRALEFSNHLTDGTMRQILRILNLPNNKRFEISVRPPHRYLEQVLALLNHGPARLDRYHYFYGLLDCASQLARIIDPERCPDGFEDRMKLIIVTSEEASFRWKAMEVLLSNPDSCYRKDHMLLARIPSSGPDITERNQRELNIIAECLPGGITSIPITPRKRSTRALSPTDCREELVPVSGFSCDAENFRISLPTEGLLSRVLCFSAAGLSTLCSRAYFLNADRLLIYALRFQGKASEKKPILEFSGSNPKIRYHAAALSEKFIVVLLEESTVESLQVFDYEGRPVGMYKFEVGSNENRWEPNSLIALHESDDRTWIAVGGRAKQDGVLSGSIKIYSVEGIGASATMAEHVVPFARPKPNPLADDFLQTLAFGPDGDGQDMGRLVCATRNRRVLIWRLADIARPPGAPFIIQRALSTDIRGGSISSATLFNTAQSHPYVFCTTCPSLERSINKGEWSFISPVGSAPVQVGSNLVHDLTSLKKSGPIVAGAVSPQGGAVALVESCGMNRGRLRIMRLVPQETGGLSTKDSIVLDNSILAIRSNETRKICPTAVRFHPMERGFCLVAIDIEGRIIRKTFCD